jgi:hypothetical protein
MNGREYLLTGYFIPKIRRNTLMFKKILLASAIVASASANAGDYRMPVMSENGFGDLALVPYYTVRDGYVSGVHVINSSDLTQVVKFRLRRGSDSMDALDFNIVMSPNDMWTGWLTTDANGNIRFNSQDTSCTAPALNNGGFTMPSIYREGAEEGYIEVIGMGSATDDTPIAKAAVHVDGVPVDCKAVRSNFFSIGSKYPQAAGVLAQRGVMNKGVTHQDVPVADQTGLTCNGGVCVNEYRDTGNVLKVAYFIRDTESGVEFGGEAVHIQNFLNEPAITNQELGIASGDLSGFDYPDLNGGAIDGTRGRFDLLRSPQALGAFNVVNDWSANPNNGVSTDWVVTMPGQYTMLDLAGYTKQFTTTGDKDCTRESDCDMRDLPVSVNYDIYDREEGVFTPAPGDLVVSPAVPESETVFKLDREVNVIEWNASGSVLRSGQPVVVDSTLNPLGAKFGFANMSVESSSDTGICDLTLGNNMTAIKAGDAVCTAPKYDNVPIIGFVAWKRNIPSNPGAEYGRIVEHAYKTEVRFEVQEQ